MKHTHSIVHLIKMQINTPPPRHMLAAREENPGESPKRRNPLDTAQAPLQFPYVELADYGSVGTCTRQGSDAFENLIIKLVRDGDSTVMRLR